MRPEPCSAAVYLKHDGGKRRSARLLFRHPTTRRVLGAAHAISTASRGKYELRIEVPLRPSRPPPRPPSSSCTPPGSGHPAPAFCIRRSSPNSWRFITHQREVSCSAPAARTARSSTCPVWTSKEASAQPRNVAINRQGAGEEEERRDKTSMVPSFVRRGEAKEERTKGRIIAEPTQTSAHVHDRDDDHEKERKITFAADLSSTFAKHEATELPTSSTAAATPATAATLVATTGGRHPVSSERQHQHAPLHDKVEYFYGRRALVVRQVSPRNTCIVAAGAAAVGTSSSISGRPTAPKVAAIPRPWALINTIGAKTGTADASQRGSGVCGDSRLRASNHGMLKGSVKREISGTSGTNPGGGHGARRWNIVHAETNAVKAFRRTKQSAAAAAARLQVGKQRWGGLKAMRSSTSIFMHALNVGSSYSDDDRSSNWSDDEGEEHGDDRSRRRGAGVGAEVKGSESDHSSSIWRESSGSDYNSSDNMSFDEEVGGRAGAVARKNQRRFANGQSYPWQHKQKRMVHISKYTSMRINKVNKVNTEVVLFKRFPPCALILRLRSHASGLSLNTTRRWVVKRQPHSLIAYVFFAPVVPCICAFSAAGRTR